MHPLSLRFQASSCFTLTPRWLACTCLISAPSCIPQMPQSWSYLPPRHILLSMASGCQTVGSSVQWALNISHANSYLVSSFLYLFLWFLSMWFDMDRGKWASRMSEQKRQMARRSMACVVGPVWMAGCTGCKLCVLLQLFLTMDRSGWFTGEKWKF